MSVPNAHFCDELKSRRQKNPRCNVEDYPFMLKDDLRESLVNKFFPYNRQITRALLHNKHIMFIGDSLVRAMYKDMLALIQSGDLCTVKDLQRNNEDTFMGDKHIDFLELEANRVFRQAREFQSNQHLIQYFFTNRAMREDLEKTCLMMEATNERPDVVVINSTIWDVSRFPAKISRSCNQRGGQGDISNGTTSKLMDLNEEMNVAEEYFNRIAMFCRRMRLLLPPSSTVVWLLMPPSSTPEKTQSGFMNYNHLTFNVIRMRLLEVNVRAAQIVREAGFDVLDLSFHFRLSNYEVFRIKDGVHFNIVATRYMNQLLIGHLIGAWRLTDVAYRKWVPRVIDKTKSEYFNSALNFLKDMNRRKYINEEIHQEIRLATFANFKLPGSQMSLEELDVNLRILLMFSKFESRSSSNAMGHLRAFAGPLPFELSRFSQDDIVNIGKMIHEIRREWSGKLPSLRVTLTNKRVQEGYETHTLLPNAELLPEDQPRNRAIDGIPDRIADASPPYRKQTKRLRYSNDPLDFQ